MSVRRRGVSLLYGLVALGVCILGSGCTIQIIRNDPVAVPPRPGPQPQLQPPGGVVQANYNGPPPNGLPNPVPGNPPFFNGGNPQVPGNLPVNGGNPPPIVNNGGVPYNGGAPLNGGAPPYNAGVVNGVPGVAAPLPIGPPSGGMPGGPDGPPIAPEQGGAPTEKAKRAHPPYVIEPPDILLIDTIRMIPKPPYVVGPQDILLVRSSNSLTNQPIPVLGIRGEELGYPVDADGSIDLGFSYGRVRVAGMTLPEVTRVIRRLLISKELKDPQVFVGLAQYRAIQQARGEHLVRPDGTVSLGSYGCVFVAGLTLSQAKVAIERHLCQYLQEPEITVDVLAYNSKYYYVITDGAGFGQQVFRFPVTGNETVLDAINNIGGIPAINSLRKLWVARPTPADSGCTQILPVDWLAITQGGATGTNYQLFPGDRVYLSSNPFIKADNVMSIIFAPIQRLFGLTLFAQSIFGGRGGGGGGGGNIGFIAPLQ